MSYGVREDGLMPLCFPAGVDFPIPSYSLAYFIQVEEYLRYSKDTDTGKELLPTLENIMGKFTQKIDSDGLIDGFAGFWNFYEWSETMSGNMKDNGKAKEALNNKNGFIDDPTVFHWAREYFLEVHEVQEAKELMSKVKSPSFKKKLALLNQLEFNFD